MTAKAFDEIVERAITEPRVTFYRRPLPDKCISFSSELGKLIFKEVGGRSRCTVSFMFSPHDRPCFKHIFMEIYFPLAEQFTTQAEPAYCGLGESNIMNNRRF